MKFSFGPFVLDTMRGTLTRDGRLVPANQKVVALLTALLRTPGETVGKTELMDAAWPGAAVEESNLSVQIAALRKLLGGRGDGGEWITTVPRVGYRFAGSLSGSDSSCLGSGQEVRPLIAVLPFSIASDEVGKEYLAHGITDDIITALVRYRWFRVVLRALALSQGEGLMDGASAAANTSGVHYALHGNVRLARQRLRISAHLIDAQSGEHLWAERYDLAMADVFAIQDEIAERVVAAIEPELLKSESLLAVTRHSGNVTAWDLVRQGMWHFDKVTREGHRAARELFRHACNIDPELPEAYSWLGRVSAGLIAYGWTDDASADGREGVAAATRAIVLDPRDPYSHYAFAIAHCYAGSANTAVLAAQSAIGINPSFALGHLVLGMALLFDGDARRAIAPLEHGLTLNPNDPQNVAWYVLLAYAQLLANDPCGALDSGNRALAVRPHFRPAFEVQVYSAAALGCLDEAKRWLARMHEVGGPGSYFVVPLRTNNPSYDVRITELTKEAVL